jgi:DNA modification methylase
VSESFLNGRVTLHRGDCLEVLPTLEECSIDSCVTDPPYHLTSIVKRFGGEGAAPCKIGKTGAYERSSRGFMGKQWDGGDIAFRPELWAEVYRVLKPGAHLLAFSGTRTYHRMACAIEDAGFEIRDQIGWCYGSGFPKSLNVANGIDRIMGVSPEVVAEGPTVRRIRPGADQNNDGSWEKLTDRTYTHRTTRAGSPEAHEWQGWGTALKPAWEPIVLARKPLSESSIAANVLKHGTGAINVDGCRVDGKPRTTHKGGNFTGNSSSSAIFPMPNIQTSEPEGRWPANLIHDGSEEVLERFPETGPAQGGERVEIDRPTDSGGSAARFFYTSKADADDRLGSKHPTVKPLDLIQYLARLVTPQGGTVLDCFAGTGTTGEAAWREGFQAVLIEREAEYQSDIVKRMGLCLSGPDERRAASVKQVGVDDTPLFGGSL